MKKKCYNNSLGFLRLGTMDPYGPEEDDSENGVQDALDLTRVHPNDYMHAMVSEDEEFSIQGERTEA